ncbi:hypothetical protein HO173_004006 [Letharia columbiana]|uniref:Uncharacterized protein n=1 Tax=Letharia columbiana TaxID=112416 RepID=A0A8H6L6T1_9LECA|nr:uncharacterized protein HO173_004006 [Letharia columbiana]KAF6237805.1 hypothetical protein HO173_004006 [Letharia columbiana]
MRGNAQGLTMKLAAMRSRLRTREVSTRKQVGDTASLVNEEERPLEDARQEL